MLGIAARNSIKNEIGPASPIRGAIRTRNSALPSEIGTANSSASTELAVVPKITGSAPNCGGNVSITTCPSSINTFPSAPRLGRSISLGRQSLFTRNDHPNVLKLGPAAGNSTITSDASITSSSTAAPCTTMLSQVSAAGHQLFSRMIEDQARIRGLASSIIRTTVVVCDITYLDAT